MRNYGIYSCHGDFIESFETFELAFRYARSKGLLHVCVVEFTNKENPFDMSHVVLAKL